jgi:hypothetical protein
LISAEITNKPVAKKQLRSFGLVTGGVFALISLWPALFHGEKTRLWASILSTGLIVPALAWPAVLRPIYRIWMASAYYLGWINTRIILSIGFFGIFAPVGLIMRLLGKDPMLRNFDSNATTYRVMRSPRHCSHLQKPF